MKEMGFNEYQKICMRTCKNFDNKKEMQANVGLGLAGEAGEVADLIKKELTGTKPMNKEHLTEELGDILWYIAEACECFDVSLQEVANKNIEKLKRRFPNGFDGYGIR